MSPFEEALGLIAQRVEADPELAKALLKPTAYCGETGNALLKHLL